MLNVFRNEEEKLIYALKEESKRLQENKGVSISDDTLDLVSKVLFTNQESGIGNYTKADINKDMIKKYVGGLYKRYSASADIYINLINKEVLDEEIEVATDIIVWKTTHYDLFIKMDGQRGLSDEVMNKILCDKPRITALMTSILDSGYKYIPILVNEIGPYKYEIADGQGRFEACKALGLPILYIKQPNGMTIKDVENINISYTKPSANDIVTFRAGNLEEKYVVLKRIDEEFINLNYNNIGYIIRNADITFTDIQNRRFELTESMYKIRHDDFRFVDSLTQYMKDLKRIHRLKCIAPERMSYALSIWTNFQDYMPLNEKRFKEQLNYISGDKYEKLIEEIETLQRRRKVKDITELHEILRTFDLIYNFNRTEKNRVSLVALYESRNNIKEVKR